MVKVILLLCLVGLVFGAYIVDQPDAAAGYDAIINGYHSPIYGDWRVKNHGTYTIFGFSEQAYAWGWKYELAKYDLSTIPSGAIIDSAYLILSKQVSSGTVILYTAQILRDWGEGNKYEATATAGECSWNCYAFPNTWTIAGCQGVGTDRTAPLDSQIVAGDSPLKLNIINTTQAIIDAANNYGMVIYTIGTTNYWYGYSSDEAVASRRPKLEVWYHDVPVSIARKWRGYYDGENLRTWGIK